MGELLVRRTWFGHFDDQYFVFELSVGQTSRSPNMVWTVRRTILRFLTDLLMRCKLQPELRCAGCTQTRVHMFIHDTCSLSSIRGRKPRQWTPRLCHALTYLLVFICWVQRNSADPPTSPQMRPSPPKREAEKFTPSAMCCCPCFFLFYGRALRFRPIRCKVR